MPAEMVLRNDSSYEKDSGSGKYDQPIFRHWHIVLLVVLSLLYAIPVALSWNRGYLDFGDGNYMYISWRLSQGAMLYRDVLAPQPPLHLLTGAALAWIGERVASHPLYVFRAFSLLLHMITMWMVYLAAWKVTGAWSHPGDENLDRIRNRNRAIGVVSAAVYLVMPIGFWWTMGYQSQPLLIFLMLLGFIGLMDGRRGWMLTGGAACGLSLLTNMTSAPYALINIAWALARKRSRGFYFITPAVLIPLLGIGLGEWITGAYISNVFLNQAGAFPRSDVLALQGSTPLAYELQKFLRQGQEILRLEGAWTAVGIIGLFLAARRIYDSRREYLLWYSLSSIGCIVYLAKGGTVDYVYSLAEPYLAIGCGTALALAWLKLIHACFRRRAISDTSPVASLGLFFFLVLSMAWPGLWFDYRTLNQRTYEMTESETMRFVRMIDSYCPPDGLMLGPPFMAFLAKRHIAEDYSEHFLWHLKYINERMDKAPGRGVETIEKIAKLLNEKKISFLVLDMNQTGTIPEIRSAIDKHYQPLLDQVYTTQLGDTQLQLYKPKRG